MHRPHRIAVVGNHAYVTAWEPRALVVLDVTDLSNITVHSILSNFTELHQPMHLEIMGNYAYLSTLHAIVTVDISNPSSPAIFGTVQLSDDLSDAFGVKVGGDYAFVVGDEGSLTVIDVSNPRNPSVVSSIVDLRSWADAVNAYVNGVHPKDLGALPLFVRLVGFTAWVAFVALGPSLSVTLKSMVLKEDSEGLRKPLLGNADTDA
ncbi:hypothetical protein AK812_SmicGene37070 [Symbiodinium microadriaticum]|uniref:Uncharacterized protein n=1 Tax=Symbiodinium microadriaticum TaxID=2951 RepID=A0A1Q9CHF0_SYMMI|nr:hypothetical protein AK812_SmicGene37070 [Symbiodinium microadriaticum]